MIPLRPVPYRRTELEGNLLELGRKPVVILPDEGYIHDVLKLQDGYVVKLVVLAHGLAFKQDWLVPTELTTKDRAQDLIAAYRKTLIELYTAALKMLQRLDDEFKKEGSAPAIEVVKD